LAVCRAVEQALWPSQGTALLLVQSKRTPDRPKTWQEVPHVAGQPLCLHVSIMPYDTMFAARPHYTPRRGCAARGKTPTRGTRSKGGGTLKIGSQAGAGLGACKRRRRAQTVVPRGEEAGNLHVRAAEGARRDAMSLAGGRPLGLHSLAIRDGKYPLLDRAQGCSP
jgi:hypothetical protein